MAGIGFRLKRLLAEDSYVGWLRAHLYGAVVSSGPWLLSICTLAALGLLSRGLVSGSEQETFRSIVTYTYTFTLVSTGALQMVVTRHVSDALYLADAAAFRSAYRWTLGATALSHAVLASVFYALAPELPLGVRVGGIALFVVVACTWMVMLFVGAAQDYASVVAAFFIGNVLSLVAALGLGGTLGATGYLGGFTLGQAATLFFLAARVEREFPESAVRSPWPIVRAFRRFASLAVGGLLYNLAITIDRLVFWASPEGFRVRSWFFASAYDAPLFLAYLSVVPALAVFLVSVETDFYERCRTYYGVVTGHGTLRQVLEAKAGVAKSLRDSLGRLAIVQVPVTLGLILVAPQAARLLTLEPIQIAILRAALIGAALHILTMFEIIVLLYFDRRAAAAEVAGVFFVGNALFTVASLALGPRFYGQGYAVAGLVACLWAYVRLEQTFENLEYLTFAGQPLAPAKAPA